MLVKFKISKNKLKTFDSVNNKVFEGFQLYPYYTNSKGKVLGEHSKFINSNLDVLDDFELTKIIGANYLNYSFDSNTFAIKDSKNKDNLFISIKYKKAEFADLILSSDVNDRNKFSTEMLIVNIGTGFQLCTVNSTTHKLSKVFSKKHTTELVENNVYILKVRDKFWCKGLYLGTKNRAYYVAVENISDYANLFLKPFNFENEQLTINKLYTTYTMVKFFKVEDLFIDELPNSESIKTLLYSVFDTEKNGLNMLNEVYS